MPPSWAPSARPRAIRSSSRARRSATSTRSSCYEVDVHGGGIDARGVTFPGSGPYVELGRGQDYSWSATSAGNDIIDIFVEKLCGDDTHYRFEGKCREMTSFDAGRVGAGAGTAGGLQRDGPRAGDRLRDRRRRAGRALVRALDARPRGAERLRLRGR